MMKVFLQGQGQWRNMQKPWPVALYPPKTCHAFHPFSIDFHQVQDTHSFFCSIMTFPFSFTSYLLSYLSSAHDEEDNNDLKTLYFETTI